MTNEHWDDDEFDADEDTTSCPHCGHTVYDDSVQCPHCHTYIEDGTVAPRCSGGWVQLIGIATAIILALVVAPFLLMLWLQYWA